MRSFLLSCARNVINAPLLYCWHWVKSFLIATLFHNFWNIFQTLDREQRKLILTRFNLESILSSLALETGTMNDNLIINSTSLQPLVLNAARILHHWLDTKLWREIACSTNPYQCFKRLDIDNFIPASFNRVRNCSHMEKLNYFGFIVFFFQLMT